jgi:mannosyl-oligosaccharide alpha-1,2-mannosidase
LNSATERYPVTSYIPLPTSPSSIPKIQHDFPPESRPERKARIKKQKAIKEAFMHSWNGYKDHAWMRDEVSPQTGGYQDSFSGWGATLVDSLDALIIMGLDDELELALEALNQIDFTTTRSAEVNVFEIIIRYMGGFLAAHDLSHGKHPILLRKAEELGEMIFNAFDTHNRMPQMRWDWSKYVFPTRKSPMIAKCDA